MSRETHSDQIARVEGMARGDDTWDLSYNDIAALKSVLSDRADLLEALKDMIRYGWWENAPASKEKANAAIAKAEGR